MFKDLLLKFLRSNLAAQLAVAILMTLVDVIAARRKAQMEDPWRSP